jgi:hypothetical protein
LKATRIGKWTDWEGKLNLRWGGAKYQIYIDGIRAIHYLDHHYYITYEANQPDSYNKFMAEGIPQLAIQIPFEIENHHGKKCLYLNISPIDALEQFAHKLFNVEAKCIFRIAYDPLSGKEVNMNFNLEKVNIDLYVEHLCEAGIVENPIIHVSTYEKKMQHKFHGKYACFKTLRDFGEKTITILELNGKPKLDILKKLIEEGRHKHKI